MTEREGQQVIEEYAAPVITEYGSLAELTAASTTGTITDQSFPAHTPTSQLTFSS